MKRFWFVSIALVLAFAPACKDEVRPLSPPLTIRIKIKYEPPNITIDAPEPDPARIAKGDTINWVVTVRPGSTPLDVTIDDFADRNGRRVDVFGDGSTYSIGGVGSAPSTRPSNKAQVVSDEEGFKYKITAVAANGDKKVLDPRIIVSAGLAGKP
jgi:hypothetical protein